MNAEPWTREQFEAYYNGGDIRESLEYGYMSIECYDEDPECHGWKMTTDSREDDEILLYGNTAQQFVEARAHRAELLEKSL